jgi:hypothetical protein
MTQKHGGRPVTRFEAIFVRSIDLKETEIGNGYGLSAATIGDAEDEALTLARPLGAHLVKVLDEGRVVSRTWLPLNA